MTPRLIAEVDRIDKPQWRSEEYDLPYHLANLVRLANAVVMGPGLPSGMVLRSVVETVLPRAVQPADHGGLRVGAEPGRCTRAALVTQLKGQRGIGMERDK